MVAIAEATYGPVCRLQRLLYCTAGLLLRAAGGIVYLVPASMYWLVALVDRNCLVDFPEIRVFSEPSYIINT